MWALVGVVINQYDASALTTGAALVATVPVVLALFSVLRGSKPRRKTGDSLRPGAA